MRSSSLLVCCVVLATMCGSAAAQNGGLTIAPGAVAAPADPTPSPGSPPASTQPPASPSGPRRVNVWTGKTGARYKIGDDLDLRLQPEADLYVYVIDVGTRGDTALMFPNIFVSDARVTVGKVLMVPEQGRYNIKVDGPAGSANIVVVAAAKPLPVDENLHLIGPRRKLEHPAGARGLHLDIVLPAPDAPTAHGVRPAAGASPAPGAAPSPGDRPAPDASALPSAAPQAGLPDIEAFVGALEQTASVSRLRDLFVTITPLTVVNAPPPDRPEPSSSRTPPGVSPPRGSPGNQAPIKLVVEVATGGRVYINGRYRGRDHVVISNLSPGSHEVTVHKEGHEPQTRMIDLVSGDDKTLTFELKRDK